MQHDFDIRIGAVAHGNNPPPQNPDGSSRSAVIAVISEKLQCTVNQMRPSHTRYHCLIRQLRASALRLRAVAVKMDFKIFDSPEFLLSNRDLSIRYRVKTAVMINRQHRSASSACFASKCLFDVGVKGLSTTTCLPAAPSAPAGNGIIRGRDHDEVNGGSAKISSVATTCTSG